MADFLDTEHTVSALVDLINRADKRLEAIPKCWTWFSKGFRIGLRTLEEDSAMSEEITDSQWALLAPLLPVQKPLGRRRADDRQTLNGILWMLRTGARWQDLPKAYGSDTRCHRR